MLGDSVTSCNLCGELKMDYIILHETYQSSEETHSNPLRLLQNGAVVVWALMHRGCTLSCQSDVHARLNPIHAEMEIQIQTDT